MLWACGDAVGTVPASRWVLEEQIEMSTLNNLQRQGVRHGSFVAGAQRFDNGAFGISVAEAKSMDPQQRLLLEHSYQAMHVSMRRVALNGSGGSVFIGMEMPDWMTVKASLPEQVRTAFAIGDPVCVASGRISFVLGLHGECKTIDTACSSGLCAVHSAVLALDRARNRFGLAAGVSLKLRPHTTLGLLLSGTVSEGDSLLKPRTPAPDAHGWPLALADGRCKTFDARANGYARAEALGVVVMKHEGNASPCVGNVVVRHDGRSASLTAPNGSAQRMMLMAAWCSTGGRQLCMEAHGTGTALGDPTEVGALAAARTSLQATWVLPISSHKGNCGHAEAPSGVSFCTPLSLHTPHALVSPRAWL
jgi:acyl transferase domain-containing protein